MDVDISDGFIIIYETLVVVFLFLKENLFNSSSNEWESRPSGFQLIWRAQFAQQPATKNNM
jgi:hypothetical protein